LTFADVSGVTVSSTVSAVTLGDVQSICQRGYTLTTHCASVETALNLCHTYIINDCPVNKFEGGLATLRTASDSTREWRAEFTA